MTHLNSFFLLKIGYSKWVSSAYLQGYNPSIEGSGLFACSIFALFEYKAGVAGCFLDFATLLCIFFLGDNALLKTLLLILKSFFIMYFDISSCCCKNSWTGLNKYTHTSTFFIQ